MVLGVLWTFLRGRSSRLLMRASTCTRRTLSARVLGRGACDLASTGSSVHRYYDPVTAQFVSVDPALGVTGQPFSYVGSDPVNHSDPTGLKGSPGTFCTTPSMAICNAQARAEIHRLDCTQTSWWDALAVGAVALSVPLLATGLGEGIDAGVATEFGFAGDVGATETEGSGANFAVGWRGTSMTTEESVQYHFLRHGGGMSPSQYAQDARIWASDPAGQGIPTLLKDGGLGFTFRTLGGGPGGILDDLGKIITFWYS